MVTAKTMPFEVISASVARSESVSVTSGAMGVLELMRGAGAWTWMLSTTSVASGRPVEVPSVAGASTETCELADTATVIGVVAAARSATVSTATAVSDRAVVTALAPEPAGMFAPYLTKTKKSASLVVARMLCMLWSVAPESCAAGQTPSFWSCTAAWEQAMTSVALTAQPWMTDVTVLEERTLTIKSAATSAVVRVKCAGFDESRAAVLTTLHT
mmetsp:Transcript_48327/g.114570  ORF Transcript_48327/g.114570 Transcript_48327/m.114570 type:complete len:215 (-) Transcript_48327:3963-4607(-)